MTQTPGTRSRTPPELGDDPALWPDDHLVGYDGVAALARLRVSTLSNYMSKSKDRAPADRLIPKPDEWPAPDRPRWRVGTIRKWLAQRPGRGSPGRKRPNRTRKPPES